MLPLVVQKGGPYLAIYLWAFMFVLSIVMMTVYPILIAPLFNKFTPVSIQYICSSLKFIKPDYCPHIDFLFLCAATMIASRR